MSYHIIRSELPGSAAGGRGFLKALISVMSAPHNWIIDAERYKILLSLISLPPLFQSLSPPHSLFLPLSHTRSFKPSNSKGVGGFISAIYFIFFRLFLRFIPQAIPQTYITLTLYQTET